MRGGEGEPSPVERALTTGDLHTVDKAFRSAFERLARSRASVLAGTADDVAALGDVRALAGKKALERLTELYAHDALACEGARRHVFALCLARLAREEESAHLRALREPLTIGARTLPSTSFLSSIAALVTERDERTRHEHVERLCLAANDVAAESREERAVVVEASRRLGASRGDDAESRAHPVAYAAETSAARLADAARTLLAKTDTLFADARRAHAKRLERASLGFLDAIAFARVESAGDGWPARASREWVKEAVPALASRFGDVSEKPALVGASSFLRVLYAFGAAVRRTSSPRSLPFVVAHDPFPRPVHRTGFLLASLAASPSFQRRALGLASGRAKDQAHAILVGARFHARWLAVRTLFALSEPSPSDFEELTQAAFGAPADAKLRGAWPVLRLDEGARFVALFEAHTWGASMVERFDEDWFRDPRAGAAVMAQLASPMRDFPPPDDLAASATSLSRALERAFG
jgi:hypothetical protein